LRETVRVSEKHLPFLHFLHFSLPIMRRRSRSRSGSSRESPLKIRVTRLCARRSRTPSHLQLSRNYCPSALRSSANIFPSMLGSSRKRHKGERVPSRQSYDALIKNYHLPTTKRALARHTRPPFKPPSASSKKARASLFPLSPTLGLVIYLSPLVPTKAKQAAASEFAAGETWQTN